MLIYKIFSIFFLLSLFLLLIYFIYLLVQGKSETGKQVLFLMFILILLIGSFVGFLTVLAKGGKVYMEREISEGRVFERCGEFKGMSSRVGTRGSETKNAYANFLLNDGSSLREASYGVRKKSESLKIGEKVCVKYISMPTIYFMKKKYIIDVKK